MSSTRIRRPEPCAHEDCGSRRFHIGDDGYTYCDRGHQQSERGAIIAEDTGELVTLGRKAKRKDSDAESATSRASSYSGPQAIEHYLLCVQLVLRKQLRWLVDVQRLPEELEVLVKDLWALRLQSVQSKISYESETDTETPSSHLFTSQSESDSDAASRPSKGGRQKDAIPGEAIPTLIETLSFAYIGMLLLRVPVTVADVHKWANDGELLYYRASREVPLGMRERLPGRYQELLEPQDLLQAEALHRCILERLAIWQKDHGMAVPRLNTPLVLYRWMRDLALPIETFAATQRLMRTLSIELDFWKPTKVGANVVLRYPEVQLMAVLVVSTKLLFPYDDLERYPRSATDLSALALDWDGWVKLHKDDDGCRNGQRQLTFESAFDFSESDCLEAANDQLDTYLDWCEGNIANEDVRERGRAGRDADFRRTLFKMFPLDPKQPKHKPNLQSATEAEVDNRDGRTRNMLRPKQVRDAIEEERGVERAGSSYRRWRTPNDLVEPMKTLYEIAAKLAGSSIDSMVQAVFLTERKVQRHEERLRKDVRSKQ